MTGERIEDIVSSYDASLIADETAARDAEVVAPPGCFWVTQDDGSRCFAKASEIVAARVHAGATVLAIQMIGFMVFWTVRETPAQIAALIARAQQPAQPVAPVRDDVREEMAKVPEDLLDTFNRCASGLVSADYALGYREACEHVADRISNALARHEGRGR